MHIVEHIFVAAPYSFEAIIGSTISDFPILILKIGDVLIRRERILDVLQDKSKQRFVRSTSYLVSLRDIFHSFWFPIIIIFVNTTLGGFWLLHNCLDIPFHEKNEILYPFSLRTLNFYCPNIVRIFLWVSLCCYFLRG